jgi:hypothetical protein
MNRPATVPTSLHFDRMTYLKTAAAGVLSATAAAAVYVAVKWGWAILSLQLVLVPRAERASEFGSWSADYPQRFDLRVPLAVGFVVGVWWMRRRQHLHPTTSP